MVRGEVVEEQPPATETPDSGSIDWSELPVSLLKGTELEWSSITADTRSCRSKLKCLFCGQKYAGGPSHIRQHLDGSIRPRHVSARLVAAALICVQHRACRPEPQWIDRHAEVLAVLQSKAADVAAVEKLKHQSLNARAKSSVTTSTTSTPIDAILLQRPTNEQVDEQWARAMVRKGLALDLVNDKEFRKAVFMTAKAGSQYIVAGEADTNLPRRTKMTTSCIPKFDAKLEAKVKKKVDRIIAETGACGLLLLTVCGAGALRILI